MQSPPVFPIGGFILSRCIMINRVDITEAAKALIDEIRSTAGPLLFHQSGGCCDGSCPMCFAQGDFKIGAADVLLGVVHGCPFYMAADQFEYWKHTHLTIDVVEGRGASFSLEIPYGKRFIIKSRVFTPSEISALVPVYNGEETERGRNAVV
jgi:uncharacterized protein (DUF779 family)